MSGTTTTVEATTAALKEAIVAVGSSPLEKPFPKHGVKVSVFYKFIEMCGGSESIKGLTTAEVSAAFIKPLTGERGSFCDVLLRDGSPDVGIATAFISHAWMFLFTDVVSAISNHFKDDDDVYLWFDLFSNDQCVAPYADFVWWQRTFSSAINEIGRTVLILSPWRDPIPFKRVWCLFEIFTTLQCDAKFEIAMTTAEETDFADSFQASGYEALNLMISNIDVQKSTASVAADRDRIFEFIERGPGFGFVNAAVTGVLRGWVIRAMKKTIAASISDTSQLLKLETALGDLYRNQADYVAAETLLVACQKRYEAAADTCYSSVDFAMNIHSLGVLYWFKGDFPRAICCFYRSLELRTDALGIDHPLAVHSAMYLGVCFCDQWRLVEAEEVLKCCALRIAAALGDHHVEYLLITTCLGLCYVRSGKVAKAEALALQCLRICEELSLLNHHACLKWRRVLGLALLAQGRLVEAEEQLVQTTKGFHVTFGPDQLSTLKSEASLVSLYRAKGDLAAAKTLCERLVEKQSRTIGADHLDTLCASAELAACYVYEGRLAEGVRLFRRCIGRMVGIHGKGCIDALLSACMLADAAEWCSYPCCEVVAEERFGFFCGFGVLSKAGEEGTGRESLFAAVCEIGRLFGCREAGDHDIDNADHHHHVHQLLTHCREKLTEALGDDHYYVRAFRPLPQLQ